MSQTSWRDGVDDLAAGLARSWLWLALARNDLRQRYFGSVLGAFWITANIAAMTTALVLVFSGRQGGSAGNYAAYVALGLILWQFIQTGLNEACVLFSVAADTLRQVPLPVSVQPFRLVTRQLLILLHNLAVVPVLLLVFRIAPSPLIWTLAPALLLMIVTLFSTGLLLGLAGERFRDTPQIVGNVLQLLFFLTPIFWMPGMLGHERTWFVGANPVFAFIDIVRAPLLGGSPMPHSWPVAATVALASALGAVAALGRTRSSLAYWL